MKPCSGRLVLLLAIFGATSIAFPTPTRRAAGTGKAGVAWNNPTTYSIAPFDLSPEVGWYYTWSPWPLPNVTAMEFVPMYWGTPQLNDFMAQVNKQTIEDRSIKAILAMNEPDQAGQSNLAAGDAAAQWKTYLEPFKKSNPDVRLGSPATVNSPAGLQWMYDFFGACGTQCTVDFVAAHWYGLANSTDFIAHVTNLHDIFQRPIWVTEWGCQNFGDPALGQCSAADIFTFLNETQTWMDATDWVERYSWLGGTVNVAGVNPDNNLLDASGQLTSLGVQYIHSGLDSVGNSTTGNGTTSSGGGGGGGSSSSGSETTTSSNSGSTISPGITQGGGRINGVAGRATIGWTVLVAVALILVGAVV